MKTTYSPLEIQQFLSSNENADLSSIEQLDEGHVSQALAFETNDGKKLVFRVAPKDTDFKADQYAQEHFGDQLPIPLILEIGEFGTGAFYCISERAPGIISDDLTNEEMAKALTSIQDSYGKLFHSDIGSTSGYGPLDVTTGDAPYPTWTDFLQKGIEETDSGDIKRSAANIGLDPDIVDKFLDQFHTNLPYASETRRLVHGDLGFDNLLVEDGEVTAIIDWAHVGYGDWMRDFAKFEFWWPNRYGDPKQFAQKYDLDGDNIDQRLALYWATSAIETIIFADKNNNQNIASWLKENLNDKLLQ